MRLPGKWQLWWCILQSKRNLPSKMAIFYFYLCSHLMWTHITDIKYPSTKPLFGFCNQESRTLFLLAPAFWTLVCGFGEQVRQRTENPKRVTLGFLRGFFAHQTRDLSVHLGSPLTPYWLLPNTVAFSDEEWWPRASMNLAQSVPQGLASWICFRPRKGKTSKGSGFSSVQNA